VKKHQKIGESIENKQKKVSICTQKKKIMNEKRGKIRGQRV